MILFFSVYCIWKEITRYIKTIIGIIIESNLTLLLVPEAFSTGYINPSEVTQICIWYRFMAHCSLPFSTGRINPSTEDSLFTSLTVELCSPAMSAYFPLCVSLFGTLVPLATGCVNEKPCFCHFACLYCVSVCLPVVFLRKSHCPTLSGSVTTHGKW